MVSPLPTLFRAPNARPFVLRPDWNGQVQRREVIDVNLGHTPDQWFTFDLPEKRSCSSMNGHVIDHAMVRWDSVGRDRPGELSTPSDLLVKGSELLEQVLHESNDAEPLVLATWNDLGEGTGINRNDDYWVGGSWLSPEHFMRKVPVSQNTAMSLRERRSRPTEVNSVGPLPQNSKRR